MSEAPDLFHLLGGEQTPSSDERPICGKCGEPGEVGPGRGDHHASARCRNGHHWWLKKPSTTPEETERRRLSRLRSEVIERDGAACLICFRVASGHEVHAGHIISRAEGREVGIDPKWIDATVNMAAMCASCNALLGSRSADLEVALRHVGRCFMRGRWTLEQARRAADFFFRAHISLRGSR